MYLLDTNICIYIINKRPQVVIEKIKTLEPIDIKLSSVSVSELEYGVSKSKFREKNREALIHFISGFDIIPFNEIDAEVYGLIRADLENRGEIIGPYDMHIASQAISRNLILVTNNTNEFQRIKNLKLENWV
ncbi:type II toxin-antitoxin system tRNA(fMet)-specific endonuclease VapC [Breznakiella homolactica]|uniref:Type II toxin-antitoxin system VapC family toxin n=1 Tax=Breznakiella homolactica TaxID=2798577 RepID=A0A7T7XK31_9SPIR|nr:type II toxin-antitoxin system VapC family toxin [Breznakiella homolactica]QQO07869.1 type II toxin-antitoxin system VapC family toxin [Breznakiella homolactica]